MKSRILIILPLLMTLSLRAQEVVRIEYFLDQDPGYGNGIPVVFTPGADATASFQVNTAGFAGGVHQLCVRARDAGGHWSGLAWQAFISCANGPGTLITRLEYYIDNDPGYLYAMPVPFDPGGQVASQFSIDPDMTGPGVHELVMRAMDEFSMWGEIAHRQFIAETDIPEDMVQMEYFFDRDPGFGNGNQVLTGTVKDVSKIVPLDLTGLEKGVHLLCLRIRNAKGAWSVLQEALFLYDQAAQPMITNLEYFFTDDPGFGKAIQVPVEPATDATVLFTMDTARIVGKRAMVVRAQDSNGAWGIIQHQEVVLGTKIWTGFVDDDWKVAGNWIPEGEPVSTDKVVIPAGTLNMPVVKEPGHSCYCVSVSSEATLGILPEGNLVVTGDFRVERE